MLRVLNSAGVNLTQHLASTELIGINAVFSQTVRWRIRKPMWLPPGKTKLFRVNPRRRYPEAEVEEDKRLYNNYRTYRTSIRYYLMDIVESNRIQFDEEHMSKIEEEDFKNCMELNDEWNKSVAEIRQLRLGREETARRHEIMKKLEIKKEHDSQRMAKIEEEVRRVKIAAQSFIKPADIDQAIEEALANPVNYNYAIDIHGNQYTMLPQNKDQQQAVQQ